MPFGSVVLHSPGQNIPVFPIQPGECDLFIVSGSLAALTRLLIESPLHSGFVLPEAYNLMH
jgi:hypothetical protein